MAILKMKRLSVIGEHGSKDEVIRALMELSCVEITSPELSCEDTAIARRGESDTTETESRLSVTLQAIAALNKYAKQKQSLLAARPEYKKASFFEEERLSQIYAIAEKISGLSEEIASIFLQEAGISENISRLKPWKELSVALNFEGGRDYVVNFCAFPESVDLTELSEELTAGVSLAELIKVGEDKEQKYALLIFHKEAQDKVWESLRNSGANRLSFPEFSGTAKENITSLEAELKELSCKRERLKAELSEYKDKKADLLFLKDALGVSLTRQKSEDKLLLTQNVWFFEGWTPEKHLKKVEAVLRDRGCAFEVRDPLDDEEPPLATQVNAFARPFTMITNMYGTPAYRSVIDPTPFMAPFYMMFFGFMLSDAAYGAILALGCIIMLWKVKPTGQMRAYLTVFMYGGFAAIFWGVLFGGYFGDITPVLAKLLFNKTVTTGQLALWFDPLENPVLLFGFCLGVGGLQIFVGLFLAGMRMVKQGRILDAIFDIGGWYLLLGGAVMSLLSVPGGLYVLGGGALIILLTAGRAAKSVIGKITGGLGALYGVTGYLSDVLSYSRLMALGLSTGVIAMVINSMGSIGGKSVMTAILMPVIFLGGHVFNIGINLLGAYVHSCRLQYIEFFGRFFEGGGKSFTPFEIETKHVNII